MFTPCLPTPKKLEHLASSGEILASNQILPEGPKRKPDRDLPVPSFSKNDVKLQGLYS